MTLRKLLDAVAGALGLTLTASMFCLPCWIPVLMAINTLGLGFLLQSPWWGFAFVAGAACGTAGIVTWLGEKKDGYIAWSAAAAILLGFYVLEFPWLAYVGYGGLAVLLWKCRKNACKIVR